MGVLLGEFALSSLLKAVSMAELVTRLRPAVKGTLARLSEKSANRVVGSSWASTFSLWVDVGR